MGKGCKKWGFVRVTDAVCRKIQGKGMCSLKWWISPKITHRQILRWIGSSTKVSMCTHRTITTWILFKCVWGMKSSQSSAVVSQVCLWLNSQYSSGTHPDVCSSTLEHEDAPMCSISLYCTYTMNIDNQLWKEYFSDAQSSSVLCWRTLLPSYNNSAPETLQRDIAPLADPLDTAHRPCR